MTDQAKAQAHNELKTFLASWIKAHNLSLTHALAYISIELNSRLIKAMSQLDNPDQQPPDLAEALPTLAPEATLGHIPEGHLVTIHNVLPEQTHAVQSLMSQIPGEFAFIILPPDKTLTDLSPEQAKTTLEALIKPKVD